MSLIIKILSYQRYGILQSGVGGNIKNFNFVNGFNIKSSGVRNTSSISNHKNDIKKNLDVKSIGEKLKQNTKTVSYMGIIALGIGVTGVVIYTIFKELFSSKSANSVYSKTLQRVINDARVQDAVGHPIKGYGEESRRRRRNHVAHRIYNKNGVEHMQMKFYIKGLRQKATVHLEMKEENLLGLIPNCILSFTIFLTIFIVKITIFLFPYRFNKLDSLLHFVRILILTLNYISHRITSSRMAKECSRLFSSNVISYPEVFRQKNTYAISYAYTNGTATSSVIA